MTVPPLPCNPPPPPSHTHTHTTHTQAHTDSSHTHTVPFVALAAHIVYTYVVETADPVVVFVGGSFVLYCSYYILDHVLTLFSERYQVWMAHQTGVMLGLS